MKFPKLYIYIGVASIIGAFLGGCASTKDPTEPYKKYTAQQIFQQGEVSLAKGSYSTATKQFEALDALYPFSDDAEQAELDLMYAYYQNDDVPSSAATADRFIRIYPRSPNVDYAYYMKGLADFSQDRGWLQRFFPSDLSERDPGTTTQSFADFAQLVRFFPDSNYAADAHQHMIYLRNLFASYELNVAQFYLNKHAYVAAANRASSVLQRFDGSPQTERALGIMVQSYRALGLNTLADQSLQTLQLNFPNGPVLQSLQKNGKVA